MVDLYIEIRPIKNGFIFKDSYITSETYCETFGEVVKLVSKSLKKYKKYEG